MAGAISFFEELGAYLFERADSLVRLCCREETYWRSCSAGCLGIRFLLVFSRRNPWQTVC